MFLVLNVWFVCSLCRLCEEVGEMCGFCVENVSKVEENSQKQPYYVVFVGKMCLGVLLLVLKHPSCCFANITPAIYTSMYNIVSMGCILRIQYGFYGMYLAYIVSMYNAWYISFVIPIYACK